MPAARRRPTVPSLQNFTALAAGHTLVPVYRTVTADLETPVSAFLRVAAREPQAFLLESVEGGESVGRYTFIGIRPYRTLTAHNGRLTDAIVGAEPKASSGDIFDELKRALEGHTPARLPGLPPFTSGAVGFFGYDVVRQIERLPSLAADELHVPDAVLMFFDEVLAFDHVRKEIHLIVTAGARTPLKRATNPGPNPGAPSLDVTNPGAPSLDATNPGAPSLDATNPGAPSLDATNPGAPSSPTALSSAKVGSAYTDANTRLDRLEDLLDAPLHKPSHNPLDAPLELTPRTPSGQFLEAVETVKEYIRAGDIFQCVLSQRFDCTPEVDPFAIYRALRIINPSPYMYFLRFGLEQQGTGNREQGMGNSEQEIPEAEPLSATPYSLLPTPSLRPCHIVGSSPELLVRVTTRDNVRRVEYRPIAGTRPRGATEHCDRKNEASLRADPKEIAEHVMLVDLGRNDIGRVSEFGSVRVKDLMFVERYSHVMHLVSALEGTLRPELTALDALRACFPAGTLSGAPKIRAMEIIEELEPARRGVYGGAIVYADFSGNLDSCIAIRTLFMDGERGHIQAGAGIVADSIPEKEHEECRNKAAAVVRAIERARNS